MIYTVKSGDSPYKIAKKLGVSFASLIAANSQKKTTVIAGVRTWDRLLPDEKLFVPVGSDNINVTLEVDTALDVEATASVAITTLNADQNYCASVRHPGTPVNVAIHNFKKAWNASGQDTHLPINTGKYEPIVARALAVVMPNLPVPDGCDNATSPHHHRGVFVDSRGVAGVGDHTQVGFGDPTQGLPGNIITGPGFNHEGTQSVVDSGLELPDAGGHFNASVAPSATIGPPPVVTMPPPPVVLPAPAAAPTAPTAPAAPDALTTLASTAATALSADPNHCQSVGHPGSAVNSAVHAFKTAWNAANPGNKVPVGTGKYEASVAAALTSLLGAGIAPDGCSSTKTKHVPQLPPVAASPAVALAPAAPVAPAAPAAPSNPAYTALQTAAAMTGVPLPPVVPAPPSPRHRPAPPNMALLPPAPQSVVATDTLTTTASAAAAALNADSSYCMSVRHPGTSVNKAVHAFKKAWNEVNPGSRVPMGTGKYESSVATALASVLGAGMAPDGCKSEEHHHHPHPPVILPPPVAPTDVAAATPPPEPPPVDTAPAATPTVTAPPPEPPPTPVANGGGGHHNKEAGLIPPISGGLSTGVLIAGGIGAAALIGIVAAAASGKGKTIIHRYKKAPASAPAAKEKR